uniref:CSON005699 protein n=1 Tax=Culicoides sonorensis TaxID=179676 RepID=A0A336MRV1_CULSO
MCNFLELDEYAIEKIFDYLSEVDLIKVSMVNSYLETLVNQYLKQTISKKLLVCTKDRSPNNFTSIQLLKIHRNILQGRYYEHICFRHKPLYFSHIQVSKNELIKSVAFEIRCYKRKSNGLPEDRPYVSIHNREEQTEITHFVRKDNTLFAGLSNGSSLTYNFDDKSTVIDRCFGPGSSEFINNVDFKRDLFCVAGKSKTVIMRLEHELDLQALEQQYLFNQGFQCVRFHLTDSSKLAAGKYHDRQKRALCLIDVETGMLEELDSITAAVYNMTWKDENIVLTANFDSTLRLTDIRSKRDVMMFQDIYDSSIYCLDYDGRYGVVCGMKHFRVNLYDLRMPRQFIQMYFPKHTNFNRSPVYSISCDNSKIFIQTDTNLRILDFNCDHAKSRDFSNMNIY